MLMIVYRITNLINQKVYIGQTKGSLKRRWSAHCSKKSCCTILKNAINKYGKENFSIEQIAQSESLLEINRLEQQLIRDHNSLQPHGYNIKYGGDNHTMTPYLHEKMKCIWQTDKYRNSQALGRGGAEFKVFEISMARDRLHKIISVRFINTWINQIKCAEDLSLSADSLNNCLRGVTTTCGGYYICYSKDFTNESDIIKTLSGLTRLYAKHITPITKENTHG